MFARRVNFNSNSPDAQTNGPDGENKAAHSQSGRFIYIGFAQKLANLCWASAVLPALLASLGPRA